uniref:Uncharacterized protein n=1 Tax=Amphora coffeiformis TaxID=265554 RepID=A0A7S3KZ47_9STRA|eukprot:scaffold437_cov159-Amphora_coffeaeformis.AAC.8
MSLSIHLQLLLTDPSVELVIDNACTHGKRQRQRPTLLRTRSTPTQATSKEKQRKASRWESTPTKSDAKDVAPVLARRMGGSATITVASSLRPPVRPTRDVAPVCRRSRCADDVRKNTMSCLMEILEYSGSKLSLETTSDFFDEDLLSNSLDLCSVHSTRTL